MVDIEMLTRATPQIPGAAPVVEVLRGGVEAIERIADEWRALCAEGPCDQPFFRPEWIRAYVRAFAPDKKLLVLTVRIDGNLRAVLPLIEERASLHGLPVRKLRSAANVHSCRFDLIHGAHQRAAAVQAIWDFLRRRTNWDVIELEDVPSGGAGELLVRLAVSGGYRGGQWERPSGPFLALSALEGRKGTLEETIQALTSTKLRRSLRYDRRKLTANGPLRFAQFAYAEPESLESFYQLESGGWKGKAGTAIACAAQTKQFYDEIAREATRCGYFSLYSLEQNGQMIAMQYCLTYAGRCHLLKPAYDEQFRKYSPGYLLTEDILHELVANGLREYDFMAPCLEWKTHWANGTRTQSSCYIFQRGVIGSLLHAWKFRLAQTARHWKNKRQHGVSASREKKENEATPTP